MDVVGNAKLTETDFAGTIGDSIVSPEILYVEDKIQSMSRQV
jgi:hypothetical protein